jgi:hypothetical protein
MLGDKIGFGGGASARFHDRAGQASQVIGSRTHV